MQVGGYIFFPSYREVIGLLNLHDFNSSWAGVRRCFIIQGWTRGGQNNIAKVLSAIHDSPPANSGVARAFPGGRLAHPEGQNEEGNK